MKTAAVSLEDAKEVEGEQEGGRGGDGGAVELHFALTVIDYCRLCV